MNHPINVRVLADGTPHCEPQEPHAQRGDTVTWQGLVHTGEFHGKILGDKQSGFAASELPTLQIDASKLPMNRARWDSTSSTLTVGAAVATGAYKYSITVAGKTLDPVIIIDLQQEA